MAAGCIFKCLNGYIFYKWEKSLEKIEIHVFIYLLFCYFVIYLLHI